MCSVTYEVIQKPIEERIVKAACLYWGVDIEYFKNKSEKSEMILRRGVVFYLIKNNTIYSYHTIGRYFGYLSHQPIMRLCDIVENYKKLYQSVKDDIKNILLIADKLNAKFITVQTSFIYDETQLENQSIVAPENTTYIKHKSKFSKREHLLTKFIK